VVVDFWFVECFNPLFVEAAILRPGTPRRRGLARASFNPLFVEAAILRFPGRHGGLPALICFNPLFVEAAILRYGNPVDAFEPLSVVSILSSLRQQF